MDIEAVRESESLALGERGENALLVDLRLLFVRGEDHDDVCDLCRLFRRHDFQAGLFRLRPGFAPLVEADDDFDAALLQVERMGVALAAVTDDSDGLVFQDSDVAVGLIVYLCHIVLSSDRFDTNL